MVGWQLWAGEGEGESVSNGQLLQEMTKRFTDG